MVPEATHYILWIPPEKALPIWCSTPGPFATNHRSAARVKKHRYRNATDADWKAAIVMGALLLFIGKGGLGWAEKTVRSGIASLLVASVSLWVVFVDWLRPRGVKPVPKVVMGLLMGFAGLALLVGPAHLGGSERVDPRGAAVLVVASLAWACGSLYSKHGGMASSAILGGGVQSLTGGVT